MAIHFASEREQPLYNGQNDPFQCVYYLEVSLTVHVFQVDICVDIHQSVAVTSKQFLVELSRHNYVTPTSYLELLGTFGKLIQLKKTEVSTQRNRTKTGLDKVQWNFQKDTSV